MADKYAMDPGFFSQPDPDEEVKRILAGIVQEAEGRLENKMHLFKAYAWAHVHYWQDHEGTLTRRHRIVKMPRGPGIDRHRELLAEISENGYWEISIRSWGVDGEQWIFTSNPAKPVKLTEAERDAIRKGLARVLGKSTDTISEEAHGPAWEAATMGGPIDIYQDAESDDERRERQRLIEAAKADLDVLFGG